MFSSRNEISKQCDNVEQEETKVNIEETTINLGCVKKELDEGEFDFDENCYKFALTFDNIFGESSKEQRDNKDHLIGFLDDEVVMEIGSIKLDVKDEEDLIREVMAKSDCNNCGGNWEGYCPDCSSLSHILNNLAPNINPEPILNTVPINTLEIREVSQKKAVFALKILPKGLILGPFEGVAPIESMSGLQWKLKDKRLVHDQNANWMQYIKSVTNHGLKNLDIFHFDGILFFETTRDIQQGEELLVCYHVETDEVLKSDNEEESYLVPVKKENYPKVFACTLCCLGFHLETCLMEHKNKCPQEDRGGGSEDFEITQCRCCKVWLVKQEYLERHMLDCLENYNRSSRSLSYLQLIEEMSTLIDGCARDSTKSEIIQSKQSYGFNGKTHAKESPSTNEKNIKSSIKHFHCGFCKKKFNIRGNLKKHIKHQHSKTKEKEYKCSECPFQTNYKHYLKYHLNKHNDVKPFECDNCGSKFTIEKSLKRHIKTLHSITKEKEYKCCECSYQTNSKYEMDIHSNKHSGIKRFQCELCEKKYSRKAHLKKHIENHHSNTNERIYRSYSKAHSVARSGIKPFQCDICKRKFATKYNLKTHIENQHLNRSEKKHKCTECSFRTNYKSDLNKHIVIHTDIKPFECNICKRQFRQKGSLKQHIEIQHLDRSEKKHKCTECSYRTNYKSDLNKHIVIHSDIKPFECNICETKINTKDNLKKQIRNRHSNSNEKEHKCSEWSYQTKYKNCLKVHSVVHSGVKPYHCDICKRKFTQKGNLKRHIEDQHLNRNEKKYKCSECSFQTKYKHCLKVHSVVHNGIKPFECDICKKKFTQKTNLNKHKKSRLKCEKLFIANDTKKLPVLLE